MNSCLHCGKEIPKGRKFCGSSCAAKYNNIHRTRKPWTEEQRQRVTKPKELVVCVYCGKPGKRVCEDCRRFSQKIPTFRKAGILEGPLTERYKKLQELVEDLHSEGY